MSEPKYTIRMPDFSILSVSVSDDVWPEQLMMSRGLYKFKRTKDSWVFLLHDGECEINGNVASMWKEVGTFWPLDLPSSERAAWTENLIHDLINLYASND